MADEFEEIEQEKEQVKDSGWANSDKKETTRSKIALLYVWAFFIVIVISFGIGCFLEYSITDFKDILIAVSGVLSGPLGFIVGYYFKASKE